MKKLNLKSKLNAPFAHLKNLRDYDAGKRFPRPYRDWRRLMIGWFFCLVVVAVVAGYVEWSINRDLSVGEATAPVPTTAGLTEAQLTKAHAVVSERAGRFTKVSQTPPILIDPAQ